MSFQKVHRTIDFCPAPMATLIILQASLGLSGCVKEFTVSAHWSALNPPRFTQMSPPSGVKEGIPTGFHWPVFFLN